MPPNPTLHTRQGPLADGATNEEWERWATSAVMEEIKLQAAARQRWLAAGTSLGCMDPNIGILAGKISKSKEADASMSDLGLELGRLGIKPTYARPLPLDPCQQGFLGNVSPRNNILQTVLSKNTTFWSFRRPICLNSNFCSNFPCDFFFWYISYSGTY